MITQEGRSDDKQLPGGEDVAKWLAGTLLGRRWHSMKSEIQRHQWIESERAGCDIGWNRAFVNWMLHHRERFESARDT